ncbi:sulfite oxidase [Salinarimonas ramus]|uniref:Molybdopterin containing oxidoreductase n=1 Tax=Salinarimonas ramus TaxID=690164 RepID=A0A917QCP8_9HYPH|nr:sulfite oxidase [Salinarimonas ramus]GGK44731.1 molybdopterin containing oxidoreductase [Salinarimonas ramus]
MHAPSVFDAFRATKPGCKVLPDGAFNCEPELARLDAPLTPLDAFFVRNNGDVPVDADPKDWTLDVDGVVDEPARFTLDDLRTRFEAVSVTAVLECAGNNRRAFDPPTDGLPWGRGAVGCARWTGVRLADVLRCCGLRREALYIGHHPPDRAVDGRGPALSRGLPLAKALAPDTLVAFSMNDAPLGRLHGAPLRIVAPGFPGSAWQKWLSRIEVRDRLHDGVKMNGTDYRLPRRGYEPGEPLDPADFDVIESMPVNAMITTPVDAVHVRAGDRVVVAGYAWSGRAPVTGVEILLDGSTPLVAEMESAAERWGWRRFRAEIVVPDGDRVAVTARASDATGERQPLGTAPWNPRGYCNNTAHEITLSIAR